MHKLPIALGAIVLLCAAVPVHAAEITRVATAMDDAQPLEVDLDVGYLHERHDTRITRESLQLDPATGKQNTVLEDELQQSRVDDEMQFRIAIGLWHDLELHVLAPYAISDVQSWDYATIGGVSVAPTSTLANNHLDISGCASAQACDPNGAAKPIIAAPGGSKRAGFRDPTIGVAWAPISEEREVRLHPELYPPGKPVSTWVVGFDYTLPLPGSVDDPSVFGFAAADATTSPSSRPSRPVIRKAHVFSLWTAFSKRYRVLDPYFKVQVNLPLAIKGNGPGDGAYDNCSHPELLADVATQNCADPAWKGTTGYQPPVTAGFVFGSELVIAEDTSRAQKFAFDLRGTATFISQGRDYTQVTDALGKLTYADQYASLGGSLGLYGRIARWLQVRVAGSLGIDTPHFLTDESIGKDLNGDGTVDISAGNAIKSREQSPTYDFRLDQVGRRLHAETSVVWGVTAFASLTF